MFNLRIYLFFLAVVENIARLCSAASDVNPDQAAEQGTAAPVAVVEDAAPQATEQPAAAVGAEDQSAPTSAAEGTQRRGEEAARTPPRVLLQRGRAESRLLQPKKGGCRRRPEQGLLRPWAFLA